jgi:hypothetical protein
MFRLRYDVRVVDKDGKLVWKKRFAAKDKALNAFKDKLTGMRRGSFRPVRVFVSERFQNTAWGPAPHDPWIPGPKPISIVYIHHSVTAQLPVTATVSREAQEMRLLDSIAHGRGFNGISYCWAVMPSSRCWEGRGFGIVEAGTEDHNTDADSIVLVGNYSSFKPSEAQRVAIIDLINRGQAAGFFVKTGLDVRPHRQTSATSCPGSKVLDEWIQSIQKAVNA